MPPVEGKLVGLFRLHSFYEVYSVGCVDVVDELLKDRLFGAFESEPTLYISINGLAAGMLHACNF
jgi:hypothetical protein